MQASLEVINLLDKIFKNWTGWDANRSYYLHTLLPDLKEHPEQRQTREEKLFFQELQHVASVEEWEQLESIAEDLEDQRKRFMDVSRTLDGFLDQNDFSAADSYVSAKGETVIQNLYALKKHKRILGSLSEISTDLERFEFIKADLAVGVIRQFMLDTDMASYQAQVRKQQEKAIRAIETACEKFDFNQAETLFNKINHFYPKASFDVLIDRAKQLQAKEERERFVAAMVQAIKEDLERFDFDSAEIKFNQIRGEYPTEHYQQLLEEYKHKQVRSDFLGSIHLKLEADDFPSADQLVSKSDLIGETEYLRIKSRYVKKYIQDHYHKEINWEKADALSNTGKNILLSARAGSGKTTVLAYKAAMLMDCYQVQPDRIMILAFNRKAAGEISGRVRKELGFHEFENARTFHSLAHQLINPGKGLLFDDGEGEFSQPSLSKYVQKILETLLTPALKETLYSFFRREMMSLERSGALLRDSDFFLYVRNRRDISLGGNRVKSMGEKYIADFLFEHDIPYSYERQEFWSGHVYHPDFSLFTHGVTIEFWGIDEKDPGRQVPGWWDITWEEYRNQMEDKRAYWHEKDVSLVEFSIADLTGKREAFEAVVKARLTKAGVECKKLSKEELEERVVRNQIDRLSEMLVQFIQKAKKLTWSAAEVGERLKSWKPADAREDIFLKLASRVYAEYENALKKADLLDFDDLMMQACNRVEQTKGESAISLGAHKDRRVKMNDLEWLLIDEYQDFSALFHNVIQAIRKYNPQIHLLCVGDDWQAINAYAGSNLRYFMDFNAMFQGRQVPLQTNFRSQRAIIDVGNALMHGKGDPGMPLPENQGGIVYKRQVNEIWIECREDYTHAEERKSDSRFVFYETRNGEIRVNDNGYITARYLKACYQIITETENWQRVIHSENGKKDKISVAILSRTRYLERATLPEFERKLHACFTQDQKKLLGDLREKIRVDTVHSFKGKEADIVIILRANEGAFPLIHPDNVLFKFFGVTEKDVLDEERRLFYVALTRAAEKLYLLTEQERESPFLQELAI